MPKRVDHDERRRQIAEAVWRIAARRGLEDVTLRQVGAEAGVSMRLVQYYFGTRHELLVKALEILNTDSELRAQERLGSGGDTAPLAVLRGVLAELLPLDEQRRTRALVHLAYGVHALHDDDLGTTFRDTPPLLERTVADVIAWGQDAGEISPDLDPMSEAELLLACTDGLGTSMILGQRTAARALALIDHQLDRIRPPARPCP